MIHRNAERRELKIFLPETFNIVLEIGCAEGGFIDAYASANERWGVEPDKLKGARAEKKLSRIFLETYDNVKIQIPDSYFDLIICNDVIEHMPDHDVFLDSIRDKLKPSGVIVGSIPNIRYYRNLSHLLFEKDWKYEDKGIRDKTHLRFFTEKSLIRSLTDHGFKIERFQGINPSGFASLRLRFIFKLLGWITCTSFRDIRYQQFGFRVSRQIK